MSRLKTINIPGNSYFITITIVNRIKLFDEAKYCQIIINNLKFYRKKYKFKLLGFVVMPNHFHSIILPHYFSPIDFEKPPHKKEVENFLYDGNAGFSKPAGGASTRGSEEPLFPEDDQNFNSTVKTGFSKPVESMPIVGSEEPLFPEKNKNFYPSVNAGSLEPAGSVQIVGSDEPTFTGKENNLLSPENKDFLIPTKKEATISDIMRDFKKFSAIQIIKELKQDDRKNILNEFSITAEKYHPNKNRRYQIWMDGFWSENIFSEKFFHQKLKYIHNNPLKAGLVKDLIDYPWSSWRNYYLEDNSLITIDYFDN